MARGLAEPFTDNGRNVMRGPAAVSRCRLFLPPFLTTERAADPAFAVALVSAGIDPAVAIGLRDQLQHGLGNAARVISFLSCLAGRWGSSMLFPFIGVSGWSGVEVAELHSGHPRIMPTATGKSCHVRGHPPI